MNVDEFLKSAHATRRTKISAFDTEMRALREHGISGQGIVNFLKLHNVLVTVSAVNQYFVRHPVRYSVRRGAAAAKLRDDNAPPLAGRSPHGTDGQHTIAAGPTAVLSAAAAGTKPAVVVGAPFPHAPNDTACGQRSHSNARDQVSLSEHRVTSAMDDDPVPAAPHEGADNEPSMIKPFETSHHTAATGPSSGLRCDRTQKRNAPDSGVDVRRGYCPAAPDSKDDVERLPFPSEAAKCTSYDSTDVSRAPSVLEATSDHSDVGTNRLDDLFKPFDFNSPEFMAARKRLRSGN